MGRRFLVGAAIALAIMALGLRMESRMPDAACDGEETVTFYDVCVYRQSISRADAAQHSPYPALAVAMGVIAVVSVAAGGLGMLFGLWQASARLSAAPDRGGRMV
jgi:hypothetical protein